MKFYKLCSFDFFLVLDLRKHALRAVWPTLRAQYHHLGPSCCVHHLEKASEPSPTHSSALMLATFLIWDSCCNNCFPYQASLGNLEPEYGSNHHGHYRFGTHLGQSCAATDSVVRVMTCKNQICRLTTNKLALVRPSGTLFCLHSTTGNQYVCQCDTRREATYLRDRDSKARRSRLNGLLSSVIAFRPNRSDSIHSTGLQ